ncbi:exodeoxyribonuclease VII large subunit [Prosthecochloris sp.]|uniref:exodeoxyribonuclease VII large subunit n=1 Tax=Prosthecochloris sp. TaxID=290513 RepID=UPI0025E8210F|nr:exodeoxyribonuclease VII large subunit [Prosthecochloris sp.]
MPEQILTVTELTSGIKSVLENKFQTISVRGEISNFKLPSSGHVYMTLKDEGAQIPAVIWKNIRMRLSVDLKDGLEIIAHGRLEVYPPSGRYQLICTSVVLAGEGTLQLAYAMLLEKLASKGYFNQEHKKQLPALPEKIGLITSATGAVIEDMSNVFRRRFPAARLLLYPVKVQGEEAAKNVIGALQYFNELSDSALKPDVVIVARGGGSLEDLQAFNDEAVALAIFNSKIPVISAIGHETDVTIADMVADVRAGTPSIAAEIAAPDMQELLKHSDTLLNRQCLALHAKVEGIERQIDSLLGSYAFNRPQILLDQMQERINHLVKFMSQSVGNTIRHAERSFSSATERLSLLDYRKTLERGFTLVKQNSSYVTSRAFLRKTDKASVIFHDGEVEVDIISDDAVRGTSSAQTRAPRKC